MGKFSISAGKMAFSTNYNDETLAKVRPVFFFVSKFCRDKLSDFSKRQQ